MTTTTDGRLNLVSVRELRSRLRFYLSSDQPHAVGTRWTKRALIVPIPEYSPWDAKAKRKALAALKRSVLALIRCM